MKKLIPLFALCLLCFSSCKKEPSKTSTQINDLPISERPIPTLPNTNNVSAGVPGGAHYICPKNCKGGTSAVQGTCPVCNSALAHNQAFHNTPPTPSITTNSSNSTVNTVMPPVTTPTTPPGPNAAGQYHYTCTKGCAGGGDTVGKCSSCSADLAHNAAFHN